MKKISVKNALLSALLTAMMMISVAGCITWEHDYYDEPPAVAYYRPYSRAYYYRDYAYYRDYPPYRYRSYTRYPSTNEMIDRFGE